MIAFRDRVCMCARPYVLMCGVGMLCWMRGSFTRSRAGKSFSE